MQRLTVDVEDYHSLVIRDKLGLAVPVSDRVDREMAHLLDLLDELRVKATCFIVGRLADERPHVVREIAGRGHEIGSHGYHHLLMQQLSPQRFGEDLRMSIRVLEAITGSPVHGFRAPAFSLGMKERWAFEIMAEEGIRFDSSIRFVWPFGRRVGEALIDAASACGIREFPGLAVGLGRLRAPLAGGGGLRLVPDWFTRRVVDYERRTGHTVSAYVHPYDLTVDCSDAQWPVTSWSSSMSLIWFDWLQRRGRSRVEDRLRRFIAQEMPVTPSSNRLSAKTTR